MLRLFYTFAAVAVILVGHLNHAVVVHHDLPDGVYQVNWHPGDNGKVGVWTYFDTPYDVNITALEFNGELPLPVQKQDVYCLEEDFRLENITMTDFIRPDDQNKAMEMLANWCELAAYVHKDAMVFAVYNDMIWFVCNWDNMFSVLGNIQRCSKAEIYEAASWLDRRCGKNNRAELSIGYWQKTYGRSNRFGDVCEGKDEW